MKVLIKGFQIATLVLLAGCGKSPDQAAGALKDFKNSPAVKQLTSEIITSLKDEELEQTVFDNIAQSFAADTRETKEKIASLTPGQRAIYVTWIVEAEVTGGGLKHYYDNSGRLLKPYVNDAFQTVGATQYADIMDQANLVDSSIQADKQKAKGNPYASLDDKFQDLISQESLDKLKVYYIRGHVVEFVSK